MTAFRDLGRLMLLAVGVRVLLAHLAARYDARLERMARKAADADRGEGGHVLLFRPRSAAPFDWMSDPALRGDAS